ncbi:hypothetical protein EMIT0P44_170072 [Pseudomonas sp. IT-P44]
MSPIANRWLAPIVGPSLPIQRLRFGHLNLRENLCMPLYAADFFCVGTLYGGCVWDASAYPGFLSLVDQPEHSPPPIVWSR